MAHFSKLLLSLFLLCVAVRPAGAQWVLVNNPYGDGYVRVNCFTSMNTKVFAGCAGGGVFVSTDNGANWTAVNTGLKSKDITALLARGTTLYATTSAGLYATTNSGTSWDSVNASINGPLTTLGTRCFGAGFNGVFVSTNSGAPWTSASTGLPSGGMGFAVIDSILCLNAYSNGLHQSTDFGGNWTQVNTGFSPGQSILTLSSNGKNLFAVISGSGMYRSTNKGSIWTSANSGLPSSVEWYLASSGTTMFAGTYGNGVYVSNNGGDSWTDANAGLPNKVVRSLAVLGSDLYVGLYEGTIYKRPLAQMITSVKSVIGDIPDSYRLDQNFPNPFNPATTVRFTIGGVVAPSEGGPAAAHVRLSVYDILGREVAVLVNEKMKPGNYQATWNATGMPSGVYFYRLRVAPQEFTAGSGSTNGANDFVETRQMILMK